MSMVLFLFTFFLIYGGIHAYVFLKAKAAYPFGLRTGVYLSVFMLFMVLGPLIIRLAERQGLEALARGLSYIGYIWLGLIFLFFSASVAIDIYQGVIRIAGALLKSQPFPLVSRKAAFLIPAALSSAIAVYGYFEAQNIRMERVVIKTSKIKERLKIAQMTDVHLGMIVRHEKLKKMLDIVRAEEPDMLVSTGDLVDGQINGLSGLAEMLRDVNPRYGKYAVVGNHEYYAGFEHAVDFTREAGFRVLRGQSIDLDGKIIIAGLDDPQAKAYKLWREIPESAILKGIPEERFVLLLKHRPSVDRESVGLFDLQLSGHVHKGQIFPFMLITKLVYPYLSGRFEISDRSTLYVSRGSGTWGPPIRFLSPPEVTIIELEPVGS